MIPRKGNSRLREFSTQVLPWRRRQEVFLRALRGGQQSQDGANSFLEQAIRDSAPFASVRPGATESIGFDHFVRERLFSFGGNRPGYPRRFLAEATAKSGISWTTVEDLDTFSLVYIQAVLEADSLVFGSFAPSAFQLIRLQQLRGIPTMDISDFEPFTSLSRGLRVWTRGLAGKRVLVVHPFEESIKAQYQRRKVVKGVRDLLPDFQLVTLCPPVTFAGEENETTWKKSLDVTIERMRQAEFDVALIGAGAYGAPLAHAAKQMGRIGIHIGASLQLLFGIMGSRWENRSEVSQHVDSSWVRPLPHETPAGAGRHEGGAYW